MYSSLRGVTTALFLLALLVFSGPAVFANHSVMVEGAQDFDGDGLLGADEDGDGDLIFGTLQGGVDGVGFNGSVTVVTSGIFLEGLAFGAKGNVIVQAAPGIIAIVEAFAPPGNDPANTARQNAPGIEIDSALAARLPEDKDHAGEDDGERVVLLRNLHIRNWKVGVVVRGNSHVTIDNCVFDSNTGYGIEALDRSYVVVSNSVVTGTGRRTTPSPGLLPSTPGVGIAAKNLAQLDVFNSVVSGSTGAGIANLTDDTAPFRVRVNDIVSSDNKPGANFINFDAARFDRPTQIN